MSQQTGTSPVEYFRACSDWTEIQYWDTMDGNYHSYLVEGGFLLDEVIGEAGNLLEELPEDAKVFITSGDVNKLVQMEQGLEDYLIPSIEFVTPTEIMNGHLRGKLGVLLITDTWFMNERVIHCLWQEAEIMKNGLYAYLGDPNG